MRRVLSARHDTFALHRPFRIARGTKIAADVITVTVAQGDVVGRGEGVPYPRYGEDVPSALAQVESMRGFIERGGTRDELLAAMPPGAARNAMDCALWDLEARLSGRSVADLVGAPLTTVSSALTVSIDDPAAMARDVERQAAAPVLKIKVDAADPAARIRAVRAAAPGAALIVDPNESWDRPLLEAMQPVLAELRVALLEQPVSAGDDAWLEGFTPSVPICADEAVHVTADLARIARRYQAVNVKLDKTGGLTAALDLAAATRAAGLILMTGCMVGSSLGIAPALHIARMSDFVDLDGPLWLAQDRPGGVAFADGWIAPPPAGFWGSH